MSEFKLPNDPTTVYRHSKYYMSDDMVTFRVQNCIYKTHKYFFSLQSGFFEDMFSLPQPVNGSNPVEGSTDENAIVLPEVTCEEFEALLDFFYFRQSINDEKLGLASWKALLSIATRFQFDKIRARAIAELNAGDPALNAVEKIVLANKHSVTDWLSPAYCELCSRLEPLSDQEALKLGTVTTAKLARAREKLRNNLPVVLDANAESTKKTVNDTFWPTVPKPTKSTKRFG